MNAAGANALIDRGIRLVGIDYLSIGDPNAHLLLLGAGVGVIEGLDLRGVDHGDYFLVCLPLKVAGRPGLGPASAPRPPSTTARGHAWPRARWIDMQTGP